jgi:hypothetical protein
VLSPVGVQAFLNSAGMSSFENAYHLCGGVYCQVN